MGVDKIALEIARPALPTSKYLARQAWNAARKAAGDIATSETVASVIAKRARVWDKLLQQHLVLRTTKGGSTLQVAVATSTEDGFNWVVQDVVKRDFPLNDVLQMLWRSSLEPIP